METTKKAWYRPDIDGLRALAIIPVLLFHANIAGFGGGFVGVDIFFVISGFLITSIIYRELQAGTFSFLTFWERRMRRIIPALFVVVVVTLIAGYFIVLLPIDYIDLGQSALAQALFLANIFFMRNNGYFAGPSENMPLLHTWSLSVEEQFYIGFPILMFLVWRYAKRALLPLLIFIGVASLLYSNHLLTIEPLNSFGFPFTPDIWAEARNATAAFFFLPSRAFELLIGALLAITAFSISHKKIAEATSLVGLGMIVYAVVYFSNDTSFPGFNALIPTLGAAAIIAANQKHQTFVKSLLSFPIFIWVGLISYSLYLWHWPLLVLGRLLTDDFTLSTPQTVLIIILSFILAYLSYRFVETPFRVKTVLPRRVPMLVGGFIALTLMASGGYLIIKQTGFTERLPELASRIAAANVDFGERRDECFVNSFNIGNKPCYIGAQNKDAIDFIIWGDSHAAALLPLLEAEATERGLKGATFISPACLPVSDTVTETIIEKCQLIKQYARAFIAEYNVPVVLLAARWSGYQRLTDSSFSNLTLNDQAQKELAQAVFTNSFTKMTTELKSEGVDVVVMKQVPQHPHYDSRTLIYQAARNPKTTVLKPTTYAEHQINLAFPNQVFDTAAAAGLISIIDPTTVLCPDQTNCLLEKDGVILYENRDHLNKTGVLLLTDLFATEFFSRW